MGAGFRLGSIAGIGIYIDWSLLIIFVLITVSLGAGVLPVWHPDWGPGLTWMTAAAASVLFFASILLHELSHALVGRAKGMRVPRITLFVFGGMAHLESEPDTWRAELAMAIVGPITSFVLGVAFILAGSALAGPAVLDTDDPLRSMSALGPLATVCMWLGPVNILLAVFNLVPGFPLDGGRVLRAALWGATGDIYRATRWASASGQFFAWLLIATGFAMILGVRVPIFGSGIVGGLWLALIGWFLNAAAIRSYQQLLATRALRDVPVARMMLSSFDTVPPDIPVTRLVDDYMLRSDQRVFPVVDHGRLLGFVGLDDVRQVDPGMRDSVRVRDIMMPADAVPAITPEENASAALNTFSNRSVSQLPVIKNGAVHGLLRREDIVRWMALRGEQPS